MPTETTFTIHKGRFAAGGSRIGPRHRENEDSFGIVEQPQEKEHGSLFVVADGVGGHRKGEVASALAVEVIRKSYFEARGGSPMENLVAAIGEANLRVHESAGEADEGPAMATTVVAAAVLDDQTVVANVGDSRAYVLVDGAIRQLSHDHSWVQDQLDQGRITPEEARNSPRRNIITRALGLDIHVETEVKTETDTTSHTRLLLCTDGVHGVVEDGELVKLVDGVDPQAAVERVLALVEARKGKDDATVVVAELFNHTGGEPAPQRAEASFISRALRRFRRGNRQ